MMNKIGDELKTSYLKVRNLFIKSALIFTFLGFVGDGLWTESGQMFFLWISDTSFRNKDSKARQQQIRDFYYDHSFLIFCILMAIGGFTLYAQNCIMSEIKFLRKEKNEYDNLRSNINGLFTIYLRKIATILKFTATERISVYIFHNDEFFICSRYSENHKYKEFGRLHFSKDKGIIGKVYEEGEAFDNGFPPYERKKEYAEYMRKTYNFEGDVFRNLTMFPQWIYGYRVSKYSNVESEAVIIIESTNKSFLSPEEINAKLAMDLDYWRDLIEKVRPHIPFLIKILDKRSNGQENEGKGFV